MTISALLPPLRDWLGRVEIPAQVLTDDPDRLRVVFETEKALAELIVGAPDCAPWRFVSFTVLDTRLELTAEPVFCFQDNESHAVTDILRELDRGTGIIAAL